MLSFGSPQNINFNKVQSWIRLCAGFLSYSILTRIVLFLSGILILRVTSKSDYADYTVINSLQFGFVALASTGIGPAFFSLGAQFKSDRKEFGALVSTAIRFRVYLAIILVPIPLVMAASMFIGLGTPIHKSIILIILAGILFSISIISGLHSYVHQIYGEYFVPQKSELLTSSTRLLSLAFFATITGINAIFTLALTAVSQYAWYKYYLFPSSLRKYEQGEPISASMMKTFFKSTLRLAPESLVAFFMPLIITLLLSFFGDSDQVADAGALTRIGAILAILTSLNASIIMPKLANSIESNRFLRNSGLVVIYAITVSAVTLLVIYLATPIILKILGPSYSYLRTELLIYSATIVVAFLFGTIRIILTSKNWLEYFYIFPIVNILSLIIALPFFDLSSLKSLLTMSLIRQIPVGIVTIGLVYFQLRKHDVIPSGS
ncbi:MAG: lipopolysaccharide biosynthesis protein [Puniceicoccaceae bacterium]